MAQAGLRPSEDFLLYMMVELPVNVLMLDAFIDEGVDGLSIGSNDLTQLTLGLDRDNQKIAPHFSETNPAVLGLIEQTILTGRGRGIPVGICGQGPSDSPELVRKLVQWGITSISVTPDCLSQTRQNVAAAERELVSAPVL